MIKETKYVTQTKEEFLEQHKDVIVDFSHYHKHTFYFTGYVPDEKNPTGSITMGYGGCSEDIYRFEVTATDSYKVEDVGWDKGTYHDWVDDVRYSFYES